MQHCSCDLLKHVCGCITVWSVGPLHCAEDDSRKLQHTWCVSVLFRTEARRTDSMKALATGSGRWRDRDAADAWRSGSYLFQSCHQWHLLSNWGCRSVFPAELLCFSYSSRIMPWQSRQRTRPRGTSVMRQRQKDFVRCCMHTHNSHSPSLTYFWTWKQLFINMHSKS